MNYSIIKKYDISNGSFIRTSVFFTGCHGFGGKHCAGCFNSELWNFNSGKLFDEAAKNTLFEYMSDEHVKGLSVLGGEPLQQGNELTILLKEVKEKFPNKTIWLWTGYYLDELNDEQKETISYCDYVVDGRFIEEKSGINIKFRGSTNQTIWEKDENNNWVKSSLN